MKSYPIQRDEINHLNVSPHHGMALQKASGIKRWILKLLPRHLLRPLTDEFKCAWIRWKTRNTYKRYLNASDLKVNIGSGASGLDGWVNMDLSPGENVNCIYDCRHHLPFPDESVHMIFTEHFMEHIDYTEDVPFFLSECLRVLQPGGVIRIIVPDAEKYIKAYMEHDWDMLAQISTHINEEHFDEHFKSQYHTMMEAVNFIFRQGGHHKYAWDYETMAFVLDRYGFTEIERQSYQQTKLDELAIDQQARASESLYVEAVKQHS